MIDVEEVIRSTARTAAIDPDVALAVARQESGLNPRARGDRRGTYGIGANDPRAVDDFCSFGLFQENVCGGAGETHLQRGGKFSDLFDPIGSTMRFAERYRTAAASFVGASPGRIAAAAQRPYDQEGYARSVDAMLSGPRTEPEPPIDPLDPGANAAGGTTVIGTPGGIMKTTPSPQFVLPNPLDRVGAEIEKARQGAAQFAIAAGVIGVALALGYMGLRKTIS